MKALGRRIHGDQSHIAVPAQRLQDTAASVLLQWNAMTPGSGNLTDYNIYRSTTSGGPYSLATTVAAASPTTSWTDTTVIAETTYYYVAKGVISGVDYDSTTADREIKVIVPPDNMALLHRWIANQEICGSMGRAVDRNNHYRCLYTGPGNLGYTGAGTGNGFFDLGSSYFVDLVETGCNYTKYSTGCANGPCLQANGAAPAAGYGNPGDVAYDRRDSNCYYKSDGTTWLAMNAATATQQGLMATSVPGHPPLAAISQVEAHNACSQLPAGGFGAKKLSSRKIQFAAAAWDSSATISTLEGGNGLSTDSAATSGNCNSNLANGISYAAELSNIPDHYELLPADSTFAAKTVRTGSNATKNCISNYGIQDLVGNVSEWLSDITLACDTIVLTCTGAQSSVDPTNSDIKDFVISEYAASPAPGGILWSFSSAPNILIPLGLPAAGGIAAWIDAMIVGTNSGEFDPARFNSDVFGLRASAGGLGREAFAGGAAGQYSGVSAGRFTISFDPSTSASSRRRVDRGGRCIATAD